MRILLPGSGPFKAVGLATHQDRMACVDARVVCGVISLKEVIQPQVPLRLPCYDFTPVADHTVVRVLPGGLDYALLVQPTPMV